MAAFAQPPLGDSFGYMGLICDLSWCETMIVVYDGHGERGPEGRVVTFVRPFVAASRDLWAVSRELRLVV